MANIHETLVTQDVVGEANVANITEPKGNEIVPHHLGVRRLRQDANTNKRHEQVQVGQLECHQPAVISRWHQRGRLNLLCYEPIRTANNSPQESGNAGATLAVSLRSRRARLGVAAYREIGSITVKIALGIGGKVRLMVGSCSSAGKNLGDSGIECRSAGCV